MYARQSRALFLLTLLLSLLLLACFGGHGGGGGGNGGGGNGGGGGGCNGGPAYSATLTHQGNFTQGQQNATYTITLTNIGCNFVSQNGNTFFAFVSEQLPSGLTLVSMAGTGWTCNMGTCSTTTPIAAGASAPPITVTVNVAPNATSPQINQVSYPGPGCPNCPTVSDSTTIQPANAVVSTSVSNLPPLLAGEVFPGSSPSITINITVANDAPGDVVTASLTMDANTTFNCTLATCGSLTGGSLGPVTATGASGSYSVQYTPPASTPSFIQTFPTLVVNSSLPNSVGSTDFIEVDPAGILVQVFPPNRGGEVYVGLSPTADTRNLTVNIYNDSLHAGVNFEPLTAAGYACGSLTTNQCGTLGTPSALSQSTDPTTGVLVDILTVPYTAPASLPSAPYNTPLVKAISVADGTRSGSAAFLLASSPTLGTLPPMWIFKNTKFKSATLGSANARTVSARILNDTGLLQTVNWKLTASGANCSPTCGSLTNQTDTVTPTAPGPRVVDSTITYTPPTTLPAGAANTTYTITAASADTPPGADSFSFNIFDPTCGTGNEKVLNGQYAFLVRGGAAPGGYFADIGSFTADGAGHITAGSQDGNTSALGPFVGATLLTSPMGSLPASSYSVGSDNRGCLKLADSTGAVYTFRFAVGTLDASNLATQGRIIRFDDASWRGRSQSGILLKQDPTSFAANQFSGNYAFGLVGESFGGRDSVAGVLSSNGTGSITSINEDEDLANSGPVANRTGTGSYILATNAPGGRGTATTTIGLEVNHYVIYMVSSSDILIMTTDNVDTAQTITLPILSGELKKQAGAPFATTALDGKDYVFYVDGVHPGDGGNDAVIGQTTFALNGNATITLDENKSGMMQPEQTLSVQFLVGSSGRTTISGFVAGSSPPVLYLIDSTSGFIVGTSNGAESGFVEQQTPGLSTSSFTGSFFLGGDAPTTGSNYQSGTASLDGAGNVNGTRDHSGPNGLGISPTNGATYAFSASSTPVGKGTVGGFIAYAVSASKIIIMNAGSDVSILTAEK
jgi:hypothetical protein